MAVTVSAVQTIIYRSDDRGRSFEAVHTVQTERTTVAPRLFQLSTGAIILFVNTNVGGRQQVIYLLSEDGRTWGEPRQLEEDEQVGLVFLPVHSAIAGRDVVVYQGLNINERTTYQLYRKVSEDGDVRGVRRND